MSRPSRSSKERSARPLDLEGLPPFFLDENVDGDDLTAALEGLGLVVKRNRVEFLRGAVDVDWLPVVGERGWTLLSSDRRQSRKPEEIAAIKRAKVRAFYFSTSELRSAQQIAAFRKALRQIARAIRKQKPPFLKIIRPGGNVKPLA